MGLEAKQRKDAQGSQHLPLWPLKYTFIIICAVISVGFFILITLYLFQEFNISDLVLIIISLIMALYSSLIIYWQYTNKELFSPIGLYAFLMTAHFVIPGLLLPFYNKYFSDLNNLKYACEAQAFVLVCFIFFHIGYKFIQGQQKKSERLYGSPSITANWKDQKVILVIILLFIIGWAIRAYIIESSAYFQISRDTTFLLYSRLHGIIRFVEKFPQYALMIVCIHYWTVTNINFQKKLRMIITLIFISEMGYWLIAGRKEGVILTIMLPIIIRYIILSKLPSKKLLLLISCAIIIMFPATHYYRSAMDIEKLAQRPTTKSISMSFSSAKHLYFENRKSPMDILFGRIALLEPVSGSVGIIRNDVWEPMLGKSYIWSIFSLVPGVLWEDKPKTDFGNQFGHASGILNLVNKTTSISVTYLGEAFLNFTWLGIFVFFFFGAGFSAVYKNVELWKRDETMLLIYLLLVPFILYIGGTFALYVGGLLKILVIFFFIGRFMDGRGLGIVTKRI